MLPVACCWPLCGLLNAAGIVRNSSEVHPMSSSPSRHARLLVADGGVLLASMRPGALMAETIDPLVRLAQRGDEHARTQLFKRHRQEVARIVARALGPDADVEDVVQDAFIQIFRSIDGFRGDSKFSTWLYRLVTNVTRMHLRKRSVRPRIAAGVEPETARKPEPGATPEHALERSWRIRRLYHHLDQLSDKKRTVIVLHDFEGIAPLEIAQIVDAPVLTVRTRLFYARRELYAALAADPDLRALATELEVLANKSRTP